LRDPARAAAEAIVAAAQDRAVHKERQGYC
jgi:hypothetical protein